MTRRRLIRTGVVLLFLALAGMVGWQQWQLHTVIHREHEDSKELSAAARLFQAYNTSIENLDSNTAKRSDLDDLQSNLDGINSEIATLVRKVDALCESQSLSGQSYFACPLR